MQKEETKVIRSHPTFAPAFVAMDVAERNADALAKFPSFFNDPAHQKRIAEVQAIVDEFFAVKAGVYVNHRTGRNRPFTVVKVDHPRFPNNLPKSRREELFHAPLRALGVEVKFSTGTNSYLIHIK
jgi:hypothetical protein